MKRIGSRKGSEELFARACAALPGGVSSPVRAFGAVGGAPVFLASAQGAEFTDVDGNTYLDFVQSWGPLILGHAHPEVLEAVQHAAQNGMTYGAPHRTEVELAEHIAECYPGVERVRFTSSGTEATMSAIRLARGATGRDRFVKFSGCYHGHSDGLLVAAGSGAVTFGQPSSAGVPAPVAALTDVLPLDDAAALESLFQQKGDRIAAVILEPMPANNGLLLQRREYLQAVRDLCTKHGVVLIFDEVISGFRVAMGGAAELYGIEPDLATFGKIIGGGLPAGAFAGRAELFRDLAPNGGIYQAGTLSGNPVAMAAGRKTLEILERDDVHAELEVLGSRMNGVPPSWYASTTSASRARDRCSGSTSRAGPLPRTAEAVGDGAERYARFFSACLERGVYLAPSAYEVGFLSQAHRAEDVDEALAVFDEALSAT